MSVTDEGDALRIGAVHEPGAAVIDAALLSRLIGVGLRSAEAADTLLQAAAIVAVMRERRDGESLEARRRRFGKVVEINVLHGSRPLGSA